MTRYWSSGIIGMKHITYILWIIEPQNRTPVPASKKVYSYKSECAGITRRIPRSLADAGVPEASKGGS
jgi:hypothetical protein